MMLHTKHFHTKILGFTATGSHSLPNKSKRRAMLSR
jgi:hypothetical protein